MWVLYENKIFSEQVNKQNAALKPDRNSAKKSKK